MVAIPLKFARGSHRQPGRTTPQDKQLDRRVVNFLYERHVPDVQSLRVHSHFGTLVISGRLATRHDKWLCLECCRRVAGVIKLIDHVEVPDSERNRRMAA